MAVILKKVKRIAAFAAALLTAAAIPCSTYADDEMIIEIISYKADGHISFNLQLGDKFLKSRNKRQ